MLKTAVKAAIPIITIQHADIIHIGKVLEFILKTKVGQYTSSGDFDPAKAALAKNKLAAFDVFYTTDSEFKTSDALYNWLNENEKTLILINHQGTPHSFDCGSLRVPDELVIDSLKTLIDKHTITQVMPVLQGLTIKSIMELVRLTSAQDGAITAKGLTTYRGMVSSSVQGLSRVDKTLPVYFANKALADYISLNKKFFIAKNTPQPLVPRGILLDGIAGVGKSAGAKYIANEFDVPLYRMDLSASLSKYVGSSERNLASILTAVEQEPACVLLIDEVEKLFGESDDSGVTYRLLAQLLWFLQEHKNRIFTVMTTNDKAKLPPELYRSGRIDQVLTLGTLGLVEAIELANAVVAQFIKLDKHKEQLIANAVNALQGDSKNFTPARITSEIYDLVKKSGWVSIDKP